MKELRFADLKYVQGAEDSVKSLVANYCNSIKAPDSSKVTITIQNTTSVAEAVKKLTGSVSTSSSTTYTMTCGDARKT